MIHLDHAVVFVRNLSQAANGYRQLGFTLTPRGAHPTLGTANHTIMLAADYLELLTVLDRNAGSDRWAAILEAREGLGAAAFGTPDARATRKTLSRRGLDLPEVIDFGRPVVLADRTVEARFTVLHLPDAATPAIPAFFCQQHTPQYVWLPEYQRHPNTAYHIAGLTVAHEEPDRVGAAYDRLLGRAFVHPHPGGVAVDLRGTRLWILRPDFITQRLAGLGQPEPPAVPPGLALPLGLTVAVRDLAATRQCLQSNGVPVRPFGRRSILVGPEWACGVHLEFVGPS